MSKQYRMWSVIGVFGFIAGMMACGLPSMLPQAKKPTATATSSLLATPPSSSGSSGGAGDGSSGAGSGSGSGGAGGSSSGTGGNEGGTGGGVDNSSATYAGSYVVKQIETLGGETISGIVCSLTQPFSVLSSTPAVTFTFNFVPQDAQHGKVSYMYAIQKAGESHDAAGTYSLTLVDQAGTLQLSMSVSDHVVFKGFDGNIPNKYKFNLVPSADTSCPPAP